MEPCEDLDSLINHAIDSVKTTILRLEAASPLLGQRHRLFQDEATRLIAALQATLSGVIALLDAEDVDPEFEALMQTDDTDVATCALCALPIQIREPHVPTVGSGVVHIRCADQLAARAQRRRRRWALAHAGIFTAVVMMLSLYAGITTWLLTLAVVGLALHIIIHRRWWYYLRRDVGRWLLLGARR
jgi:hypothetical protein